MEGPRILGIAAAASSARIRLDGLAAGTTATAIALRTLAAADIAVEHLDDERAPDGTRRLDLILAGDRADEARRALQAALGSHARIQIEHPIARITVVGSGLSACGANIALALQRLSDQGIEPQAMGFSELGLTLYLSPGHADEASRTLHETLVRATFGTPRNHRRSA